jgi:hypothetical protein
MVMRKDFPSPIARAGRCPLFDRDEVIAFRDGQDFSKDEPYWDQERIVDSAEIQRIFDLTTRQIQTRIEATGWHLIPKPLLRVTGVGTIWLRADVEEWLAANERSSYGQTRKR